MKTTKEISRIKVSKISGRPFKSGFKTNTATSIVLNPHSGKLAYAFIEDDSVVDCYRCVEKF